MMQQEPEGQARTGGVDGHSRGGEIRESRESSERSNKPLLADLFWRDEILQVMYWYQGEGFGSSVTARDLQTFLSADEQSLIAHLERMVVEGYLERPGGTGDVLDTGHTGGTGVPSYSFTEYGAREGARRFADEFAEITKQGHGDCPPDCPICKDLPPEDCVHCHSNIQEEQLYGV